MTSCSCCTATHDENGVSLYGGPHPIEGTFSAEQKAVRQDMRTQLAAKLKSIGGERVNWMQGDLVLYSVFREGRVFDMPVKFRPGEPSMCHRNALTLWAKSNKFRFASGYALSKDGLWRPHSWVVDETTLYETTVEREAYFGIVYDGPASAVFWEMDFGPMSNPRELRRYPGLRRALEENVKRSPEDRAPLQTAVAATAAKTTTR